MRGREGGRGEKGREEKGREGERRTGKWREGEGRGTTLRTTLCTPCRKFLASPLPCTIIF